MGVSPTTAFCAAGKKTQVLWSSSSLQTYRATFNLRGVTLAWERHSDLAPWFTWGTHVTDSPLDIIVAGNYCAFWIMSPVSIVVRLESIACAELDFMHRRSIARARSSNGD